MIPSTKKRLVTAILATFTLTGLTACGGGGGGGDSSSGSPAAGGGSSTGGGTSVSKGIQMSGAVVDGYIENAIACLDLNADTYCQLNDEPSSTTDAKGRYQFTLTDEQKNHPNLNSAMIVVFDGQDTDTGARFLGKLFAPQSVAKKTETDNQITFDVNITPITSLVAKIGDKDKVAKALGLSSTDSLGDDPIKKVNEASTQAEKEQAKKALAQNLAMIRAIETLTTAVKKSGADLTTQEITDEVLGALKSVVDQQTNDTSVTQDNAVEKWVEKLNAATTNFNAIKTSSEVAAVTAKETTNIIENSDVSDADKLKTASIKTTAVSNAINSKINDGSIDVNSTSDQSSVATSAANDAASESIALTFLKNQAVNLSDISSADINSFNSLYSNYSGELSLTAIRDGNTSIPSSIKSAIDARLTILAQIEASKLVLTFNGNNRVTEGSKASYEVIANKIATQPITIELEYQHSTTDFSATDADFSLSTTQVTIPANKNSASFTIQTTDDFLVEAPEDFQIKIKNPTSTEFSNITLANDSVTTRILSGSLEPDGGTGSSDTVYASIEQQNNKVAEGSSATYTVKLSHAPTEDVMVPITSNLNHGATASPEDLASAGIQIPETITFGSGETSKSFRVDTVLESSIESDESFSLSVGKPTTSGSDFENLDADPSKSEVTTIIDNPDYVFVKLTADASGDEGSSITHTITLVDGDDQPIAVGAGNEVTAFFSHSPQGEDASSDDFNVISSGIIPEGQSSAPVTVNITEDYVTEATQGYTLTLDSVSQGSAGIELFEGVATYTMANSRSQDAISVTGTINDTSGALITNELKNFLTLDPLTNAEETQAASVSYDFSGYSEPPTISEISETTGFPNGIKQKIDDQVFANKVTGDYWMTSSHYSFESDRTTTPSTNFYLSRGVDQLPKMLSINIDEGELTGSTNDKGYIFVGETTKNTPTSGGGTTHIELERKIVPIYHQTLPFTFDTAKQQLNLSRPIQQGDTEQADLNGNSETFTTHFAAHTPFFPIYTDSVTGQDAYLRISGKLNQTATWNWGESQYSIILPKTTQDTSVASKVVDKVYGGIIIQSEFPNGGKLLQSEGSSVIDQNRNLMKNVWEMSKWSVDSSGNISRPAANQNAVSLNFKTADATVPGFNGANINSTSHTRIDRSATLETDHGDGTLSIKWGENDNSIRRMHFTPDGILAVLNKHHTKFDSQAPAAVLDCVNETAVPNDNDSLKLCQLGNRIAVQLPDASTYTNDMTRATINGETYQFAVIQLQGQNTQPGYADLNMGIAEGVFEEYDDGGVNKLRFTLNKFEGNRLTLNTSASNFSTSMSKGPAETMSLVFEETAPMNTGGDGLGEFEFQLTGSNANSMLSNGDPADGAQDGTIIRMYTSADSGDVDTLPDLLLGGVYEQSTQPDGTTLDRSGWILIGYPKKQDIEFSVSHAPG